jgi:diadenosine tetraphosphate (Ap4A) HIT family hydrolase
MADSPFLAEENYPLRVKGDALSFIQVAKSPASRSGHVLIIPTNIQASPFNLTDDELASIFENAKESLRLLTSFRSPQAEGYTIVWNINPIAGQSVPHAHLHIIGRNKGDTLKNKAGEKIPSKGGIATVLEHQDTFYDTPLHAQEKIDLSKSKIVEQDEFCAVIDAPHSVVKGHALVTLKDNPKSFLDMTSQQFIHMVKLAGIYSRRIGLLDKDHGLNIGWDINTAAGQIYEGPVAQIIPRGIHLSTVKPEGVEDNAIMTVAKIVRPTAPDCAVTVADAITDASRLRRLSLQAPNVSNSPQR